MAKVVTSQGIEDFVREGKHTVITPDAQKVAKEAPALEVVADKPVLDVKTDEKPPEKAEEKVEAKPEDEGLEADDVDFPETVRRKIGKKHRAMKEAQEAAAEAERFAENQYNRARLAEQRADELERRLKETEQVKPKAEPEVKKPAHDDKGADGKPLFYDEQGQFKAFEYAEKLAEYSAQKAVSEDRKRQVEEAQKAAAEAAQEAAKARVAESRKKHSDYDEVVAAADVKTHAAVLQYMSASDHIGEIAYHLAKNPDFVERINKLNPLKAIAEIGKLELSFEKPAAVDPPAPKAPGAPPPIKPLQSQSAGAVELDPSKMSFKQLREYERQKAANKRR